MSKENIKRILRESLFKIQETEPKPSTEKDAPKERGEKDYSEIQKKLSGTMLKQSQVMAAAGLGNPDDATDRSLFSKKLRREKNDEGGIYQFNDDELSAIIKVINNPNTYLNTKTK